MQFWTYSTFTATHFAKCFTRWNIFVLWTWFSFTVKAITRISPVLWLRIWTISSSNWRLFTTWVITFWPVWPWWPLAIYLINLKSDWLLLYGAWLQTFNLKGYLNHTVIFSNDNLLGQWNSLQGANTKAVPSQYLPPL